MWGLHVREGEVARVGCPEVGCESNGGFCEATEDELRAVLSEEEVKRWRWLRRKRDLERDPTTVHCPMEYCQEPVPRATTAAIIEDDESTWGRLRECHSCGYSFCSVCKRTWYVIPITTSFAFGYTTSLRHGPLPLTSKIILAYLAASEDERIRLERHYGRTSVQRMVTQHKEDEENRKWLESSTTECPGCA
ncbi:hypothetical protein EDD15DRAFT_1035165 [Pisolithus albus]|nr:hypothetical protein EDD15DRAFT_1035165 [Pisolithus albus]